ncbi:MerR family transcriptional regulator [Saccharibacillus sacchari]|uniref:MerR family transcriptional regulator n=1 Tax=Saccharibacillus sacchari TaxID=456493 RepID=UPI0004B815D1|nr:MerR family transcriptional regulator [Saccharibacillus sacchari]
MTAEFMSGKKKSEWTPKQASLLLQVSTTTLRRYEQLELIPIVSRHGVNRRVYTQVHMNAFAALRILAPGYGISVSYEAMRLIRSGKTNDAFWLINEQQSLIHEEKQRVMQMMQLIAQADFCRYNGRHVTENMTIRDVAEMAGVNTSAIRYWEKEGLISPARNARSGYRVFGPRELRRIVVISSLRRTVYFIENMRRLLDDLDTHNLAAVEKSFRIALEKLDQQLALQYKGITAMMRYADSLREENQDRSQRDVKIQKSPLPGNPNI